MTGQSYTSGFLRLLSTGAAGTPLPPYLLPLDREVVIGREPSCQIVLDSNQHGVVSRRHAAIRPLTQSGVASSWQICDLNSANGTYVNGRRLQGCQMLHAGDRIELGQNGTEFIFEFQTPSIRTQLSSQPFAPVQPSQPEGVTFTQLFPIFSTGRDLTKKAYLVPGMVTVGFVVLMFAAVGESVVFNLLLAAYLAWAAYYFVYQLCGKHKPWWVLLGSAVTTALILVSPVLLAFIYVFRRVLPGDVEAVLRGSEQVSLIDFPGLLIRMFFGAGLMEELLKALPVLGLYLIGRGFRSPLRDRIGVWEPLDGILLGTASAVGFTLLETLGQYIPQIIQNVTLQAGEGAGELVGLQLLIPRILGSVAGHMAYSGYLGYFIGLSALKPKKRWTILLIGYLTASGLHALWNATGAVSGLLLAVVGIISYAFLTAAILKARALSPTRNSNFATRFTAPP
ncbi:PrsW family intramembrane metalloprotease [Coleofasciculus sp. FACHB-64]|uniref:PrsW family glutamic-type intramembrane protease n=1 Tax=Cyanophyceae TaxID=3028117 RepID=UPI001682C421|nr:MULTISPECIES: PrsW family glutamic-type intramembrane protease [unclassified Coleofasciculus]MBD1837387.1 PrsW family intramembrane metalloprotease [Coleofasciculus sp. FACHB-501]MBD2044725.1 PrsW family intramembrane metalloprotease [Coleofasciculus sp. FACHB-64]